MFLPLIRINLNHIHRMHHALECRIFLSTRTAIAKGKCQASRESPANEIGRPTACIHNTMHSRSRIKLSVVNNRPGTVHDRFDAAPFNTILYNQLNQRVVIEQSGKLNSS